MAIGAALSLTVVFLGWSAGWFRPDAPSRPISARSAEETVRERLLSVVGTGEGERADPWLLAHALLALDRDDQSGRQQLIEQLQSWRVEVPGGGIEIALHRPEGRGEQHPDLVLKVLAEVAAETGDRAAGAFADELVPASVKRFTPPRDFRSWNDRAWFLQGVAMRSLVHSKWGKETRLGESDWTFGRLAEGMLTQIERGDRVVEEALGVAGEFVRPDGMGTDEESGIYAYTCGGQHLLQAVIYASIAGWLPESEKARLDARLDLFSLRLAAEEEFRLAESERALAAGVSELRVLRRRIEATLKLQGHALETLSAAHQAFPSQRPTIDTELQILREKVVRLLEIRVERLDPKGEIAARLRAGDPRAWELWFGDGAHALHGLLLAGSILGK